MYIEQLTEIDIQTLNDFKKPYRDSMTISVTMIGILSLLIAGVFFIDIYEESFLFRMLQIQWTFPVVFTTIAYLWYKLKVRTINVDLKSGTKRIEEFVVESKGTEKYGTYSTGNYFASGSSNRHYLKFGAFKYNCSKEEFENFKIGDKLKVAISHKASIILMIEMLMPNK
ncbi:hypothetical protein [Saccharicrinis aurantiacus]|uniref:hypothetical protein n=2 Tax=Saccharicrinis aurantiacus TaxID=1849719 RepID=UPI00094FD03D|nr:hypothetical protein [Saccharicrinis aurantiacus]